MLPGQAFAVFDSLTEKQHEALRLASGHLTSKQIALELGVAPVTIDKRIEAVRARLGSIPRPDLLRAYAQWAETYDRPINGPIIVGEDAMNAPDPTPQPAEFSLAFQDSLVFDRRASWERQTRWLQPGVQPSDLGMGGKLLAIIAGAAVIMIVAVLVMAFANALMSMIER